MVKKGSCLDNLIRNLERGRVKVWEGSSKRQQKRSNKLALLYEAGRATEEREKLATELTEAVTEKYEKLKKIYDDAIDLYLSDNPTSFTKSYQILHDFEFKHKPMQAEVDEMVKEILGN